MSGLNELKQLTGSLTKFADESGVASKSPTLGKTYNFINETIKKNLPEVKRRVYEKMNQKFAQNIDTFDDLVKAFNKGDPFTRMAQVFGENKDSLRQIVNYYEKKTGQDIMAVVAGRKLAQGRQAAFGLLNPREWIDFLFPPESQARAIIGGKKIISESANRGTSAIGRFLRLGGQRALGAFANVATRE